MANAGNDGEFDGLVDGFGNLTDYGKWMVDHNWARRTGDGAVLTNGGKAQAGSANNRNGEQGNNPDGSSPVVNGTPATGAGAADAAAQSSASWSPGSMIIGDDGTAWLEVRSWNKDTQDYVYKQVELGNPNGPGFSWDAAAQRTGLAASQLRAQYDKSYLDWQQTEAGATAMKTWRFDAMDPATGEVSVKNGAGAVDKVGLQDITSAEWRAAHPGVNLQDVQNAVIQANRANWLQSTNGLPNDPNYTTSPYLKLGQAYSPGATSNQQAGQSAATGSPVSPAAAAIAPTMPTGANTYRQMASSYQPPGAGVASTPLNAQPVAGSTLNTMPIGGGTLNTMPIGGSSLTGGGTTGNNPAAAKAPGATAAPSVSATPLTAQGSATGASTSGDRSGGATGGTPVTTPPSKNAPVTATPGTGAGTGTGTGGKTIEQLQQEADAAKLAQLLASMKQYSNISGTDAGQYTGTDFYGKAQTLTKDQLIASGSATASDLYKAQLSYADMIRRYGQAARAGRSQFLGGFNPNAVQSTVAGG